MGKYQFAIKAYYADNDYLEIPKKEIELFEVDKKKIFLKSIDEKKIKDSKGIKIESEIYDKLDDCISVAKKVYSNFLLRLNATDISYILDKTHEGNFCEYCSDKNANLYNEIIIIDLTEQKDKVTWTIERGKSGCTHFRFNKLLNVALDEKIKQSLFLNNYRKYLYNKNINYVIDNTLATASIEMLLEKANRSEEEINVIEEVISYLNQKYEETNKVEYLNIMNMVKNNKHKSINSLIKELIEKYSLKENIDKNKKLIDAISDNRAKEIHYRKDRKKQHVWADQLIFDIQKGYMNNLYKIHEQEK